VKQGAVSSTSSLTELLTNSDQNQTIGYKSCFIFYFLITCGRVSWAPEVFSACQTSLSSPNHSKMISNLTINIYAMQRITRGHFQNIGLADMGVDYSQSLAVWLSMLCQISCVTL